MSVDMAEAAFVRCWQTPERSELIYSPTFARSYLLFQHAPEVVRTNAAQMTWFFPNGSRLVFGYPKSERYRGQEFQFIDYDPDTSYFAENDVADLTCRVRP